MIRTTKLGQGGRRGRDRDYIASEDRYICVSRGYPPLVLELGNLSHHRHSFVVSSKLDNN